MNADRLTRLVDKVAREGFSDLAVCVTKEEAIQLLRRERSYQLARVRRIIKSESARLARMDMTSREAKAWITAKQNVLAVILDALNRRTT